MSQRNLPFDSRILILSLVCTLFVLFLLAPSAFAQSGMTGQIAYVRAGDIWLFDLATNSTRRLTTDGKSSNPSWSPDGQSLVFASSQDGSPRLYQMNADGSQVTGLTDGSQIEYLPDWAADGSLFFTRILEPNAQYAIMRHARNHVQQFYESGIAPCRPVSIGASSSVEIAVEEVCGTGAGNSLDVFLVNSGPFGLDRIALDSLYDTSLTSACPGDKVRLSSPKYRGVSRELFFIESANCFDAVSGAKDGLEQLIALDYSALPTIPRVLFAGELTSDDALIDFDLAPDSDLIALEFGSNGLVILDTTTGQKRQVALEGRNPAWRPNVATATEKATPTRATATFTPSEFTFGCAGFGKCPTDTPAPSSSAPTGRAVLKLTYFTLADTLFSFSSFTAPHVLKQNRLWIEITNIGDGYFNPPNRRGDLEIQVVLKRPGSLLEEHIFTTRTTGPSPLRPLKAGESQTLVIPDLFFFTPVEKGELEVFIRPARSLAQPNSILSKPITVGKHPEGFCNCAAEAAAAIFQIASIQTGGAAIKLGELGAGIAKGGCKGDAEEALAEIAKWYVGVLLEAKFKEAGKLFSLGLEAGTEIENRIPACIVLADWMNAYLTELLFHGYDITGVLDLHSNASGTPGGQVATPTSRVANKLKIGNVSINNIFEGNVYNAINGNIEFVAEQDYEMHYFPNGEYFMIAVLNSPFETWRSEAEQAFLAALGVSRSDACLLNVEIVTPRYANPAEAGAPYPLSFC